MAADFFKPSGQMTSQPIYRLLVITGRFYFSYLANGLRQVVIALFEVLQPFGGVRPTGCGILLS